MGDQICPLHLSFGRLLIAIKCADHQAAAAAVADELEAASAVATLTHEYDKVQKATERKYSNMLNNRKKVISVCCSLKPISLRSPWRRNLHRHLPETGVP